MLKVDPGKFNGHRILNDLAIPSPWTQLAGFLTNYSRKNQYF